MEEYIQVSAKTKSEAITKAAIELGTASDELDIIVVSEGSSGFFGIGIPMPGRKHSGTGGDGLG